MKGDEFKIILEDINEKFDTMIEGHKLLNEKLDRQIEENRTEHKEIRDDVLFIKKDVLEVKNVNCDIFHYENIGGVCRNLGIKTKDFYKWKKENSDFPKSAFRHRNQPMW
jgi:hypothetical protein